MRQVLVEHAIVTAAGGTLAVVAVLVSSAGPAFRPARTDAVTVLRNE